LAYPFAQCPTFRELKNTLEKEFGCKFKQKNLVKNRDPYTICYFERIIEGNIIQCSVDSYDDEERIAFPVIRSICRRLKIDPARFGLVLG
jgi:hypothetical protein